LKKDTVTVPKQKISKQDKQIARKKNKQIRKYQYKYGYDSFKKEYNRNLEFITSDTTATVAYMKIRSFTKGGYKDFYKE
ncbi:peptidase S41, partial [Aquimarina celericrescens]|nr:peptidase S41 [Aquimarina celericrescens]